MTEKENKINSVKGYGIIPCFVLAIATDLVIAKNIHTTADMGIGLLFFGIVLFVIWVTIWFKSVDVWYKYIFKK